MGEFIAAGTHLLSLYVRTMWSPALSASRSSRPWAWTRCASLALARHLPEGQPLGHGQQA
jgi:hypothetical protein